MSTIVKVWIQADRKKAVDYTTPIDIVVGDYEFQGIRALNRILEDFPKAKVIGTHTMDSINAWAIAIIDLGVTVKGCNDIDVHERDISEFIQEGKTEVFIEVQGGLVQEVNSNDSTIEVILVDYDNMSESEEESEEWNEINDRVDKLRKGNKSGKYKKVW